MKRREFLCGMAVSLGAAALPGRLAGAPAIRTKSQGSRRPNFNFVYTDDPRTNPNAVKLDEVTFADALQDGLRVADATAFALCMENKMPRIVFGMEPEGNILRAVQGERIGTLVSAG